MFGWRWIRLSYWPLTLPSCIGQPGNNRDVTRTCVKKDSRPPFCLSPDIIESHSREIISKMARPKGKGIFRGEIRRKQRIGLLEISDGHNFFVFGPNELIFSLCLYFMTYF